MYIRHSVKIVSTEELESYKRCKLFNEVYAIAQTVKKFKARHKLVSAALAQGINISFGERRIYISKDRVSFDLYCPYQSFSTIPEIRAILEDQHQRYQFSHAGESDEPYESSLYNAYKDIENTLSGEMTASEFLRKRKGLAVSLRALADEVEAVTV